MFIFVKKQKGFFGFLFATVFFVFANEPAVGNYMATEVKVNKVALHEVGVRSLKLFVNFTHLNFVETEVVKDITEMGDRNVTRSCFFLVVEVKSEL